MYDLGLAIMKFTVDGVTSRVTAPTLVTVYQDDTLDVPPAEQGSQLFKLLRGPKRLHTFTAAEGAQFHCRPMAPQTRNQVVYDWIDGVLQPGKPGLRERSAAEAFSRAGDAASEEPIERIALVRIQAGEQP